MFFRSLNLPRLTSKSLIIISGCLQLQRANSSVHEPTRSNQLQSNHRHTIGLPETHTITSPLTGTSFLFQKLPHLFTYVFACSYTDTHTHIRALRNRLHTLLIVQRLQIRCVIRERAEKESSREKRRESGEFLNENHT